MAALQVCLRANLKLLPVCQARSHDVKAQLAATTAELEELRSRQHHLEARNVLLEKISDLSSKKPNHASLDEVPCASTVCILSRSLYNLLIRSGFIRPS